MTQKLKGIDNIKKAMERRVEERQDVMEAESARVQESRGQAQDEEDGVVP
ncbi:MAG: hypothetical protein K5841_09240 [Fretibacterium sp.]|nr:hypothetical protein [Fretibacterium sp.]